MDAAKWADQQNAESVAERMILGARGFQVQIKGYTPEHDERHANGELLRAALCYLTLPELRVESGNGLPLGWPWGSQAWQPGEPRENLVRGGALAMAERERLQRIGQDDGVANRYVLTAIAVLAMLIRDEERAALIRKEAPQNDNG